MPQRLTRPRQAADALLGDHRGDEPVRRRTLDLLLGRDRHASADRRRQLLFGFAGVGAVAALMAASAIIYVLPIGKTVYDADLSEAGSVRVGDEVRIAGITVGAVKSLELHDDSVHLRFTVDHEVFVGDQSTLDIRMLTAIGGHYLALIPAGSAPLGSHAIPVDRVRLPYSLARALQDSQRPLAAVDADTLRHNIDAVGAALEAGPGSLRRLTDSFATMVTLVDRQNSDVSRALDVADQYLKLLNSSRSVIGAMVTKIGVMETTVLGRRAEVLDALRIITELLARLAAIEPAWRAELEPLADQLVAAVPALQDLGRRLGDAAASVNELGTKLRGLSNPQGPGLSIDQSAQTVPAVCVPLPGKDC